MARSGWRSSRVFASGSWWWRSHPGRALGSSRRTLRFSCQGHLGGQNQTSVSQFQSIGGSIWQFKWILWLAWHCWHQAFNKCESFWPKTNLKIHFRVLCRFHWNSLSPRLDFTFTPNALVDGLGHLPIVRRLGGKYRGICTGHLLLNNFRWKWISVTCVYDSLK